MEFKRDRLVSQIKTLNYNDLKIFLIPVIIFSIYLAVKHIDTNICSVYTVVLHMETHHSRKEVSKADTLSDRQIQTIVRTIMPDLLHCGRSF